MWKKTFFLPLSIPPKIKPIAEKSRPLRPYKTKPNHIYFGGAIHPYSILQKSMSLLQFSFFDFLEVER
jgi:hypothetical protein